MKKLLLFFIGLFFIPTVVFAEDNEIVIDFSKIEDDLGNMTFLQNLALEYLEEYHYIDKRVDEENDKKYFVNQEGKELIVLDVESYKYSIAEGVTSDDNFRVPIVFVNDGPVINTSTVPQGVEIIPKLGDENNSIYGKYEYIHVKFDGPMPAAQNNPTIEINLFEMSDSFFEKITMNEYQGLSMALFMAEDNNEIIIENNQNNNTAFIKNKDGKLLFTMTFVNNDFRLIVGPEVTAEDNIVVDLVKDYGIDNDIYLDYFYNRHSQVIIRLVADPVPEEEKPVEPVVVNPYTFSNIYFVIAVLLGVGLIAGNQYFVKKLK